VHEPEKGHTLRLKVGQRADVLTGRIEESYERRQAAAPRAPEPPLAVPPAAPAGSVKPRADGEREDDENVVGAPDAEAEKPH
jgi:hypothetical protein